MARIAANRPQPSSGRKLFARAHQSADRRAEIIKQWIDLNQSDLVAAAFPVRLPPSAKTRYAITLGAEMDLMSD
jgi:hypothetical protein